MLRAIKSGRLKNSLVTGEDGKAKIGDVALADAEWHANTDLSKAPGSVKERQQPPAPGPAQAAPVPAVPPPPAEPGGQLGLRLTETTTLAEASAEEKRWKARQAELDYRTAAGELVRADIVTDAHLEEIQRAKVKLLGIPSKFKARSPHLSSADVRVLDQLIREALEELAADDSSAGAA